MLFFYLYVFECLRFLQRNEERKMKGKKEHMSVQASKRRKKKAE